MLDSLRRCLLIVALILFLFAALVVVSQTMQLVAAATAIHPVLGTFVLYGILLLFGVLVLLLVIELARLPSALVPVEKGAEGYEAFLNELRGRLKANPYLQGVALNNDADLAEAIRSLDERADAIIKRTASAVFVTTAVSQSGRLDGFAVLGTQLTMIWQLARVYNQRPALRELGTLYWQVLGTALVASELDEAAIGERIGPVVQNALSDSVLSLIPGVAKVASVVTQAIFEGASNAFLTLRVGLVCRSYCGALSKPSMTVLSRNATLGAGAMLGAIVASSAATVVGAMTSAFRRAGEATIESASSGVRNITTKLNPFRRSEDSSAHCP